MAAPACAPDLEDGELYLPKDIFPDEDDLLLWRVGTDNLAVKEPEGPDVAASADYDLDLDFDLNELATKLAALGLGLGVLPPLSECRGNNTTFTALAPPPPPPVLAHCGADSGRFDRRPAPPPRKQLQPQPPWVLGPRAAEALMLRRRQQHQRAAALFAARASALGLPVVELEGGGGPVVGGFASPRPVLLPRVSSGSGGGGVRAFPAVTQGCNGSVAAMPPGGAYPGRHHLPHAPGLPIPVARRRCGGTGVFLPRVSSSPAAAPAPPAATMMKHKVEQQQHQLMRYHQLQASSPAAATVGPTVAFSSFSMVAGRDGASYRSLATPPAAALDWSPYY